MPSVFANGVWKSGNNLLLKVLELMDFQYHPPGIAASLLNGRYRYFKHAIRGRGDNKIQVGLETDAYISSKWIVNKIYRGIGCSMSGHAAYSDTLSKYFEFNGYKNIFIVRDPRDVAISFAHWIGLHPEFSSYKLFREDDVETSIYKLIQGCRSGSINHNSLSVVYQRAYGWIGDSNTLVVKFEDLVGEKGGGDDLVAINEIKRIANHIGINNPNINYIFDNMYGSSKTFRSGKVRAYSQIESESLKKYMNNELSNIIEQYGYSI